MKKSNGFANSEKAVKALLALWLILGLTLVLSTPAVYAGGLLEELLNNPKVEHKESGQFRYGLEIEVAPRYLRSQMGFVDFRQIQKNNFYIDANSERPLVKVKIPFPRMSNGQVVLVKLENIFDPQAEGSMANNVLAETFYDYLLLDKAVRSLQKPFRSELFEGLDLISKPQIAIAQSQIITTSESSGTNQLSSWVENQVEAAKGLSPESQGLYQKSQEGLLLPASHTNSTDWLTLQNRWNSLPPDSKFYSMDFDHLTLTKKANLIAVFPQFSELKEGAPEALKQIWKFDKIAQMNRVVEFTYDPKYARDFSNRVQYLRDVYLVSDTFGFRKHLEDPINGNLEGWGYHLNISHTGLAEEEITEKTLLLDSLMLYHIFKYDFEGYKALFNPLSTDTEVTFDPQKVSASPDKYYLSRRSLVAYRKGRIEVRAHILPPGLETIYFEKSLSMNLVDFREQGFDELVNHSDHEFWVTLGERSLDYSAAVLDSAIIYDHSFLIDSRVNAIAKSLASSLLGAGPELCSSSEAWEETTSFTGILSKLYHFEPKILDKISMYLPQSLCAKEVLLFKSASVFSKVKENFLYYVKLLSSELSSFKDAETKVALVVNSIPTDFLNEAEKDMDDEIIKLFDSLSLAESVLLIEHLRNIDLDKKSRFRSLVERTGYHGHYIALYHIIFRWVQNLQPEKLRDLFFEIESHHTSLLPEYLKFVFLGENVKGQLSLIVELSKAQNASKLNQIKKYFSENQDILNRFILRLQSYKKIAWLNYLKPLVKGPPNRAYKEIGVCLDLLSKASTLPSFDNENGGDR